ncbi:MAG: glycine cleavage system protein GcvH [Chloroflexi bacterium]|nr:glycine cleavage system protein GcvH [Chloroflexota bacterium]
MATVNSCNIPDDLYYWVEKHTWCRREADGTVIVGITDVAQFLAKSIISATPKEAGKAVKKGKSAGTVESGKWVGPVTAPVNGALIEVNAALKTKPSLLNSDPYGAGWFIKIKPDNWEADSADLVTGSAGVEAYQKFLDAHGIKCE